MPDNGKLRLHSACVPPERDVCQNQLTAHSFVASPSNDFMTIGVLGTFLLLVIALLGRWSGSAKLNANGSGKLGVDHPVRPTVNRSADLGATQIAAAGRPARARIILVGIGVLLLWLIGVHFLLPLSLAYRDTPSAQLTAYCIQHLHQRPPVPGEYILIIEGSSVTTRGVDGAALERSLRGAGIPVTVIQLSLSGANHLERLQLLQNFANSLSSSDWQRLRESRLILGHEVQALYDRDPLLNYGNNPFTPTTLAYSNPDNLPTLINWMTNRYDLRELWNRRSELQLIATQFLYNALRISSLQLWDTANRAALFAGFQPAPKRADFQPVGLLPIDFPPDPILSGRQAYPRITRWNVARDAAFRSIFKGTVRSELFFSLPGWLSYEFNYDNWWSNAHPTQLFFNGNRPQIRTRLREPRLWNDPGHLANSGAEIYTEELSQFLKGHWPAQPG
jgi:hypothetical protein